MQGRRGTARQGRSRGAIAGGVGEGSRRGQRGGNRPPPTDLAQGDWAGAKSFRRGVDDFCGDFRPRREEEIQAGDERFFWYAKQMEARSHTRGLARHA